MESSRALPTSLKARTPPWWHWSSLLGRARRAYRFITADEQYVGTLTGTVTWRHTDGELVELIHYDCFIQGEHRSFRFRTTGRYCRLEGMKASDHPMHSAALSWAAGRHSIETWHDTFAEVAAVSRKYYQEATRR